MTTWNALVMAIWPMRDVKTFFETRFAVGRLGWMRGNASVRPTDPSSVQRRRREGRTGHRDRENEEEVDVQELKVA